MVKAYFNVFFVLLTMILTVSIFDHAKVEAGMIEDSTLISQQAKKDTVIVKTVACLPGEASFFDGNVLGDHRMRLTICARSTEIADESIIAVRWSEEGRQQEVSCLTSQCDDVIGIRDYVRYRMNETFVTWVKDGKFYRLIDYFSAENPDEKAVRSIFITYAESLAELPEAPSYQVVPAATDNSLLEIGEHLPLRNWSEPAFGAR